jgi:hypothetical protein
MTLLLGIAAVILVVVGLVLLIQGAIVAGILLMVIGFLVEPGGYSSYSGRRSV